MEFKEIVRIVNADIYGKRRLLYGLTRVKGVKYSFANAVCNVLNLDPNMKIGELSDELVDKISDVIRNPSKYGFPSWLLNRRKDPKSGDDLHFTSNDLAFSKQQDLSTLKKLKNYKGVRHARNLPVRGQKTRSNFRKGKIVRNRKIKIR